MVECASHLKLMVDKPAVYRYNGLVVRKSSDLRRGAKSREVFLLSENQSEGEQIEHYRNTNHRKQGCCKFIEVLESAPGANDR